jgi:hypothetical protein
MKPLDHDVPVEGGLDRLVENGGAARCDRAEYLVIPSVLPCDVAVTSLDASDSGRPAERIFS